MNHTKQQILNAALDLFSIYGFTAVSIRDICKKVKIKESTVYYHFKNKQAIFDELLRQFETRANQMMQQLEQALSARHLALQKNFYETVCHIYFEEYFMDPFCNKVMRLLLIEHFNNNNVQKLYDYWMFLKPLSFQSKVFTLLTDTGLIRHADSEYLAVKFYAPIFLSAQRRLFCGILSEQSKQDFLEDVNQHINHFFQEIGVISWQTL